MIVFFIVILLLYISEGLSACLSVAIFGKSKLSIHPCSLFGMSVRPCSLFGMSVHPTSLLGCPSIETVVGEGTQGRGRPFREEPRSGSLSSNVYCHDECQHNTDYAAMVYMSPSTSSSEVLLV